MKRNLRLEAMMTPTIESFGCELVGIESVTEASRNIMRVFIDKDGGVKMEDLAAVSHQLSQLLDVEMPDASKFYLEVSSPGLDRILFTLDHFKKVIGKRVNVKLDAPVNGRRHYKAKLIDVVEAGPSGASVLDSVGCGVDSIILAVQNKDDNEKEDKIVIPFSDIDKARLIPEI